MTLTVKKQTNKLPCLYFPLKLIQWPATFNEVVTVLMTKVNKLKWPLGVLMASILFANSHKMRKLCAHFSSFCHKIIETNRDILPCRDSSVPNNKASYCDHISRNEIMHVCLTLEQFKSSKLRKQTNTSSVSWPCEMAKINDHWPLSMFSKMLNLLEIHNYFMT